MTDDRAREDMVVIVVPRGPFDRHSLDKDAGRDLLVQRVATGDDAPEDRGEAE